MFEQLVGTCPGLTWNQIFLEVDRLSRAGHVQLSQAKPGGYCIRLAKPPISTSATMGGGHPVPSKRAEEQQGGDGGCRRCGGLLVPEQLPDFSLDSGAVEVWDGGVSVRRASTGSQRRSCLANILPWMAFPRLPAGSGSLLAGNYCYRAGYGLLLSGSGNWAPHSRHTSVPVGRPCVSRTSSMIRWCRHGDVIGGTAIVF